MKRRLVIFIILACGIAFRMWFASLVPQPFINDQRDYDDFALKILSDPHMIGSHSFRSYPYPLLLAFIYKFAGFANHQAVFFVQAVMDSFTGLLVFGIVRQAKMRFPTALVGMVLYMANPFTAGYVNVVLAEVMTTFFLACTVLLGLHTVNRPRMTTALAFGLAAGITAETRNAAFIWTVIPIIALLVLIKPARRILITAGITLGFVLSVIYPGYANWRDFGEFNITTVDSFYAKELFNGVVIRELPPLAPQLPKETYVMYSEYYSEWWPDRDAEYREMISDKYYAMAIERILADPMDYIRVRFKKMWYVWQKEALYVYVEPGFERRKHFTYALNTVMLSLASLGIVTLPFDKKTFKRASVTWLWWTTVGTVLYGTLVFSLTHAEHRLTIPFFPLLITSSLYGLGWMTAGLKKIAKS